MNRIPLKAQVKNKAPAAIQISAEQLLREATERQEELFKPPERVITDVGELGEYQLQKRRGFEDALRRNRSMIGAWIKYAQFEESQGELERARSIYERAIDIEHRNVTLWLKYIEMEMKHKNVMHARNLFDRVVALLPRVDQFWYKYTYMEELIGNVPGARQVFDRWLQWQPDEHAWQSYIKMELRYNETQRCRRLYEQYIIAHSYPKTWVRYARFEEDAREYALARSVYERAVESIPREFWDERLFLAFAKFEMRQKEYERADMIFKYGLEQLPKSQSTALMEQYTPFQKQHGGIQAIEDAVTSKSRLSYEEKIKDAPYDYDVWFNYAQLEESVGNAERVRDIYERAIAQIPQGEEKRFWRRYIYLWIAYALFEELDAEDVERTRGVYKQCIKIIPHDKFTFTKIWTLYAQFEVRQKNVVAARKALGQALGLCPKESLFKSYIGLELKLLEFDRCRILYEKFLIYRPNASYSWMKFAEFEHLLGENERARALYVLALEQTNIDMPEALWKAAIDFETDEGNLERARLLFEQLLSKSDHGKVWTSYALFESVYDVVKSRDIFRRAIRALKDHPKEEKMVLLEGWKSMEQKYGDEASLEEVRKKWPKRVRKRKQMENGEEVEYFDYIFPEEYGSEGAVPTNKLMEAARKWKEAQAKIDAERKKASDETEEKKNGNDEKED